MTAKHNQASRILALIEKEKSEKGNNDPSQEPGRIVAPSKVVPQISDRF